MQVFIENLAGSRRKNIYDERALRHLSTVDVSASYPYPYGFVIGTVSGDGDAVDCFVLTSEPLTAGTILECDPIGLLEQIEDGEIPDAAGVIGAIEGRKTPSYGEDRSFLQQLISSI